MYLKKNIYIMYAMALLQGMVFYGPIATLYRQAIGLSVFQITLIETISFVLSIFLELPWGIIADKIGYRKSMIVCSFLYFMSKIVFWKASCFEAFLLERIILSIVMAGLSGLDTSILYQSAPQNQSQKIFGIYNYLGEAGLLFAAGIYSFFIKNRYRLAAFATIISYGIATLLTLGLQEVKKDKQNKQNHGFTGFQTSLYQLIQNRTIILFLISIALFNQTHQMMTVFLNQVQYTKCHAQNQTIGYIYVFVTLVGLLGVFSSNLTHRFGQRKVMTCFFIVPCFCCLVLGLTNQLVVSVIAIALIRICFSLLQPLQLTIQNDQIQSHNRATTLSLYAMIMDLFAAVQIIFGRLADINLSYAMYLGAFFCLISFLLYRIYYMKNKK